MYVIWGRVLVTDLTQPLIQAGSSATGEAPEPPYSTGPQWACSSMVALSRCQARHAPLLADTCHVRHLVGAYGRHATLGSIRPAFGHRGLARSVRSWGSVGWCEVLVFGGSLVGMKAAFSVVEDAVLCAVAKVVMWQAWRASPPASVVVGAESGCVYL
jgi:hypothetical protein